MHYVVMGNMCACGGGGGGEGGLYHCGFCRGYITGSLLNTVKNRIFHSSCLRSGDGTVVERRTHDQEVSGLSPGRSSFYSCVTAVARKRSRSLYQKYRW